MVLDEFTKVYEWFCVAWALKISMTQSWAYVSVFNTESFPVVRTDSTKRNHLTVTYFDQQLLPHLLRRCAAEQEIERGFNENDQAILGHNHA